MVKATVCVRKSLNIELANLHLPDCSIHLNLNRSIKITKQKWLTEFDCKVKFLEWTRLVLAIVIVPEATVIMSAWRENNIHLVGVPGLNF